MLEKIRWDCLKRDDLEFQVFYSHFGASLQLEEHPRARLTKYSEPYALKITLVNGETLWFNEAELKLVADLITKSPIPMSFRKQFLAEKQLEEEEEDESNNF